MVQWIGIHLPIQGTWVWSLVWKDSTCHGATKPMHHHYWAHAVEPASSYCWSQCTWSLCSATGEATAVRSPHTVRKRKPHLLQLRKACVQQQRLSAAKNTKEKENHWQQPMLVRIWSNRNSHLLLVRMQNGTDILKGTLVLSYKTKHMYSYHMIW